MITLLYGAARPDRNPRVGRGRGSGPSLTDTVAPRFRTKLGELIPRSMIGQRRGWPVGWKCRDGRALARCVPRLEIAPAGRTSRQVSDVSHIQSSSRFLQFLAWVSESHLLTAVAAGQEVVNRARVLKA